MAYRNQSRLTKPAHCCDKDVEWISGRLSLLSPGHQARALTAYSDSYITTYNSVNVEHKRENAARSTANNKLRVFVGLCLDSYKKVNTEEAKGEFKGF